MNNFHFRKIKQLKDWKSDLNAVLVFAKTDEETRKDTVRYISLLDYAIEQIERVQELERKIERHREALEEISNADWNSEGLDAERELDKVTDVAFKALEESE